MADVSWNSSVLNTGKLTIDAPGLHGNWSIAVTAAIRELNAVITSSNVNVSLTTGSSAVVTVAVTAGSYTSPVNGVNQSGRLRTDVLHGATRSIDYQTGRSTTRDYFSSSSP